MKPKLLIAEPQDFSAEVLVQLKKYFSVDINDDLDQNGFEDSFYLYDIIWFRFKYDLLNFKNIKPLKCKTLVCPVTGPNHINGFFLNQNNIHLLCLKGETDFLREITPTAELTIFLTMSLMRYGFSSIQSVKNGEWNRDCFRGEELKNKTVGIIGYGRLGKIVEKYFKAFNCKIKIYDINNDLNDTSNSSFQKNIKNIFSTCNIITLHVDLNKNNYDLIDYDLLQNCNNTYLINTSRGEIINEEDLLRSISEKKIKGYAADVLKYENKNFKESLVYKEFVKGIENIILTPHIGGNTKESFYETEKFLSKKLINYIIKNEK